MSIMSSPFKHPSSGTYYLRKGVPKHLTSVIGKTEFKQSLRTKDLREAKKRIIPLLADIDQQLDFAELTLRGENNHELSLRDCQIIANRWYVSAREKVQKTDSYDDFLVYHNQRNEGLVWDSSQKDYRNLEVYAHWFGLSDTLSLQGSEILRASNSELQGFAQELAHLIDPQLKLNGLSIPRSSISYINLAKAFYSHLVDLEKLCLSRYRGKWNDEPRDMSLSNEPLSTDSGSTTLSMTLVGPKDSISNVYERWRASDELQHKNNQSRLKTLDETKSKVERFVSILGDMDIATIKKSHIAQFRDTLLQLPKSRTRQIKRMTISEQIEYASSNSLNLLSSNTVTNAIKQISPVFTYAVELGLISFNPTFGVSVKNTQKRTEVDDKGRGYTPKDFTKLFSDEVFTDPRFSHKYGLACYWVPLLCRYTGARLAEIAQLDHSDVSCSEQGIHYLNIRRGEGQSVKTDSSLRHIPIAEHILELGFLDYVDRHRGRLFPDIPVGTYGKNSVAFSKWWSSKVKSKGVSISQPAHAFRHAFKTDMRTLNVSDSVSDAITGHSAKSEGARYGTVPLETKKEAIDRLPRLSLVRLY
ncbi:MULTISPECIES: site-specific integrase [unclassified Alteromonas]|uniref:site-specific integrase n=1 Tax=unclassified Alteromonas TaxID=2614992 RepID=UPI00050941AE|nr:MULTISPECIES: site-specific integrase [unclassified Alteromonas]